MSRGNFTSLLRTSLKAGAAVLPLTMTVATIPAYAQAQGAAAAAPAPAAKSKEQLESEAAAAKVNVEGDAAAADDAASIAATGGVSGKDIVVTGTSIRGIAPTGTTNVSVTREDIQASGATSAAQVLATIPQIGGNYFNSIPQANEINSLAASNQARNDNRPNLRPSPGSALDTGSSTLILIDGNRTSGVGVNSNAPTQDSVPAALLERVEVAIDGASSVYGSDAISGVINYVTRRKFDGLQIGGRYGFAPEYKTYDLTGIVGKEWSTGSAYVSYSYVFADRVFNRDRNYVNPIDFGTTLERDLNCDNANIRITGTTPLRYYATTATGVSTTPFTVAAPLTGTPNVCRSDRDATLAAGAKRHNALASIAQDFGSDVKMTVRGRYAQNSSIQNRQPITFSNTITNTNPYWRPLTGTADAALTNYVVLGNFGPALGTAPFIYTTQDKSYGVTAQLDWNIDSNWQVRTTAIYDESKSSYANPSLTAAAITAGFQGTTAVSTTTTCSVQRTTAACFNPFNIAASDPALIAGLLTSETAGRGRDQIWNFKAVIDGRLFSISGGDVRVAMGAEYLRDHFAKAIYTGLKTGTEAALGTLPTVTQTNKSVYGEINVPLVSSANAMPLLRELRLSASGRYDHYKVYGGTFNPRIGASYKPFDWLRLRGNYNTSFRSPTTVDLLGFGVANSTVLNLSATQVGGFGPLFIDPNRPIPASMGGPTNPGNIARAISLQGTHPDLGPQKGRAWSAAIEVTPIQGLFASLSYYHTYYKGAFGNPCISSRCFPDYAEFAILFPTQAQYDAFLAQASNGPTLTPKPALSELYGLFDTRKNNMGNTVISGLDYQVRYTRRTDFGSVFGNISGNVQLVNKTQLTSIAPFISNIDWLLGNASSLHRMTVQLGMTSGPFRLTGTLNRSFGFRVISSATTFQDKVSAYNVVNLAASYEFKGEGIEKDLNLSLTINNIFNTDPPVLKRTGGNGYTNGRTLGRVIQLGIQKKFF